MRINLDIVTVGVFGMESIKENKFLKDNFGQYEMGSRQIAKVNTLLFLFFVFLIIGILLVVIGLHYIKHNIEFLNNLCNYSFFLFARAK